MITYNRPEYTDISLKRLLDTCDETMRVWVWHNGMHKPTLRVVNSYLNHPRLHKFHHNEINVKLTEPTNWLWQNSDAKYLSKVDDDGLMPYNWAQTLKKAHEDEPKFGILGCWRFFDEDFSPTKANKKIKTFNRGHRIMQNCWIEGSGYLMKRKCIENRPHLVPGQTFTGLGIELSNKNWIHGWYYPFLYQEHMDDPRSPNTLIRTDKDLAEIRPLMAQRWGVKNRGEFIQRFREEAQYLQAASSNPKSHRGWRRKLRQASVRINEILKGRSKSKPAG